MYKNGLFVAILKDINTFEVVVPKSYNSQECQKFYLYENNDLLGELKIISLNNTTKTIVYQLSNSFPIVLGKDYVIMDERNIAINLDCSRLMLMDKYVDRLYSNKEMGAIYSKKETTFRIFSPLATIGIVIIQKDGELISTTMLRDEKTGVLEASVKGNYASCVYYYLLKINNEFRKVSDPYARSVTIFSKDSVIVNENDVEIDLNNDKLKPFGKINDAIIYELSIRDMTSFKNTDIKNKGKYLGLTEQGIKTKNNNPVGLDYLKSLGVTHVQILPMYDFNSTNDAHPEDTYNWGYDPCNYNSPEGSFATDCLNPLTRIIELKKMISKLHENNIRVVMDVVYNHVFNMETSCFEDACPKYYFRYNSDGYKSDGSFCGNEFESRHLMGRKYIVDSCKYWVKEFGVDGFRFDLMGLIDIDTINEVYETTHEIKDDIIIYGEGWDMPTCMSQNMKSCMSNASMMPNVGFFNDRFRDITKGKTSHDELYVRGYLSGDTNYVDGFKHIFSGSVLPLAHPPLFNSSSQSINYVECHDNNTIYDKLKICCYDDDENSLLRRVKLINACVMLANGVPFFHMGQEIGLSKNGEGNSYRSGDLINQFNYDVLDKRVDMYNFFKDLVEIRKEYPFLRISTRSDIEKTFEFTTELNGVLKIRFKDLDIIKPYKDVVIFVNPTKNNFEIDLSDYYRIVLNESGKISSSLYAQFLIVNPLSLVMCVKE